MSAARLLHRDRNALRADGRAAGVTAHKSYGHDSYSPIPQLSSPRTLFPA